MTENDLMRFGVKKFTGNSNDFRNWKIRVECALKEKTCWSAIGATFDTKETGKELVNEAMNDAAKAIIVSTISDNVLDEVYNDLANVMWASLLTKYEKLDFTGVHFIRQRFFNCKQEKGETVENYISRVQTFKGQLDQTDQKVNDTDVIMQIYGGVLPEFTHFVQILIVNKETHELNLKDFKMALINEEKRQKDANNNENCANEVYFSKENKQKGKKNFSKRTNGCYNCNGEGHDSSKCKFPKNKCFKCGELGHLAPYCDLAKDLKEKNGKRDIALTTSKQNKDNEFLFWCNDTNSKDKNSWILDSGATNHICCLRELFTTIQLFKSSVLVADGRQIQIEGKGNVELETISNGKRIKITMTDVLFAPTMKINLISIGILAKKGFSMIFSNQKCKIKFENRLVAKLDQWKQNTNLYELRVITRNKELETKLNTRKVQKDFKETKDEYVVLDLSNNIIEAETKDEIIREENIPPLEDVVNNEIKQDLFETNDANDNETSKILTERTEDQDAIIQKVASDWREEASKVWNESIEKQIDSADDEFVEANDVVDVRKSSVNEESIFKPANVKRVRTKVKQFQPGLTDKEIRKANQSDNLKQGNTKDPPDTEN
jgi:hypothetical protein